MLLFFITLILPFGVNADDNVNKIFKIEAYNTHNTNSSKVYVLNNYGSAIYIGNNMVVTDKNLLYHPNGEVIWNYRVCETMDFKKEPDCKYDGKLLYYNIKNDLAVIELFDTTKFNKLDDIDPKIMI